MTTKKAVNPTLAALRKICKGATRIYVHAYRDVSAPSYSDAAFFEVSAQHGEGKGAVIHKLTVPGVIRNGETSHVEMRKAFDGREFPTYPEAYRPDRGFWSLFAHEDALRSVLQFLPNNAEVSFDVALDAGTTQAHMLAGFHCDYFRVIAHITRKTPTRESTRRHEFLIEVDCGPHNTARFGTPNHERDTKGRGD